MSWIGKNKVVWRIATVVMAFVAMMGPWVYDRISVPAEYACSAPNVRLDGDFCGIPLTGVWIYSWWVVHAMVGASEGLLRGAVSLVDWARGLLWCLSWCLFLLPFVSTLLLILRGDRRRRQVLHLMAWGLTAGLGVMIGMVCSTTAIITH